MAVALWKWTGICLVVVVSFGGCTSPRTGSVRTGTVADVADTAAALDDGLAADSSPSDAGPDSVADTSPDAIGPDAFADVAADAKGDGGTDVATLGDTPGQRQGGPVDCCTEAGVCPAGAQCMALSGIGWSTCVPVAEPGRCWKDVDCPAGQKCQGAAFCPCNLDCGAGYFGPGVCTPPPPACTAIQPAWVAEICNAKGLVVWNGTKCVSTCPGCCGCEPFCDKTFESQAACQEACL